MVVAADARDGLGSGNKEWMEMVPGEDTTGDLPFLTGVFVLDFVNLADDVTAESTSRVGDEVSDN
jgi:hypothetical protein